VPRTKSAKKADASQQPRRKKDLPQAIAETKPATIGAFAVGDRVSHPLFGDGIVKAIEGAKLTIAFDALGDKEIIDSYVKRQKK
jgi:DNA helicase-2/ATP-dependent DNA helicase PcrA